MPASYITVKVTPGRISKGLLSIPVSLRNIFPSKRLDIFVLFDNSKRIFEKPFSPYESSTRECRIYGLSDWYKKHSAKGGERIVITVLDKAQYVYRLSFEDYYLLKRSSLQEQFFVAKTERKGNETLESISKWTGNLKEDIAIGQFQDLSRASENELRRRVLDSGRYSGERVPPCLKILLRELYGGHCQVCDFYFLRRDGQPFFEIHHLKPERGHHPKNILSVCANCHRQFEYADVNYWHNSQQWLIRVKFNDRVYPVYQMQYK